MPKVTPKIEQFIWIGVRQEPGTMLEIPMAFALPLLSRTKYGLKQNPTRFSTLIFCSIMHSLFCFSNKIYLVDLKVVSYLV